MKALTVRQPWAYIICAGIKDVENRTWKTNFRGRVFIHTSAKPNTQPLDIVFTQAQLDEMLKRNTENYWCGHKEYGAKYCDSAIIGSVEIVDCGQNYPSIWAETAGAYQKPIWNWVLKNLIFFDKPIINVKGRLSFWESDYEEIVCPQCGKVCLHGYTTGFGADTTFGNYCHECERCGYMICESEWEDVNANIINKLTEAL